MINLLDYYAINWEATSDNIRSYILCKGVSIDALAGAMYKTPRTIKNWCNNTSRPSLDDISYMAAFFNVELNDLLVTNGQIKGPITKKDLEDIENEINKSYEKEQDANSDDSESDDADSDNNDDNNDKNKDKPNYEFENAGEIIKNVAFNSFVKSTYPVTNLFEFLSFLPLVEPRRLIDVLYRLSSFNDRNYVYEQLKRLYDSIKDSKAKKHVEFVKRFIFQYPSIETIDTETKFKLKKDKYQEYIEAADSDEFTENFKAYDKHLEMFGDKICLAKELEYRLKSMENK